MDKRWVTFTEHEHVDHETGEIIRTSKLPKNHIRIKKRIKYEENGNYRIKTITYECEKIRQLKLF